MTVLSLTMAGKPRRGPNPLLRMLGACQEALAAWHAHQRRAQELGLPLD